MGEREITYSSQFIDEINQSTIVAVEKIPIVKQTVINNVDNFTLFRITNKLIDICKTSNGIGLSAVQIGIPFDVFIIKLNNNFKTYFDCNYFSKEEKIDSIEGCLSLRDENNNFIAYKVKRYPEIEVIGKEFIFNNLNLTIRDIKLKLKGNLAICFQHEIDHGKGILISDFGTKYNE